MGGLKGTYRRISKQSMYWFRKTNRFDATPAVLRFQCLSYTNCYYKAFIIIDVFDGLDMAYCVSTSLV